MEICCMQTFYLVVYPRLLLCHEETRLFLEPFRFSKHFVLCLLDKTSFLCSSILFQTIKVRLKK